MFICKLAYQQVANNVFWVDLPHKCRHIKLLVYAQEGACVENSDFSDMTCNLRVEEGLVLL
jgi:hypothetical protein